MRFALCFAILGLAACDRAQPAAPPLAAGTYVGSGRDALCVARAGDVSRAGFIVYGAGATNCSASGTIEKAGRQWSLVPTGDSDCRIPLDVGKGAGRLVLGRQGAACAYYCGPGASFAGKQFTLAPAAPPPGDLAGDPLC